MTNDEVIKKLTEDFPGHTFNQVTSNDDQGNAQTILTIDGEEGRICWATMNEEKMKMFFLIKNAEEELYNGIKYEVNKFLTIKGTL